MTDEEWRRRVDLAACYRLVDLYEMSDGIGTHISARAPGAPDAFLAGAYGVLFDEVTASSLVKVDAAGKPVDAGQGAIKPAGFVLHSCIHAARPEVVSVLHTHTVAGMAVSALAEGLLPLTQHAMQFCGRIGYHAYEGLVTRPEEQERLIADLGGHKAMVLRNHGLVTVGTSIAEAFYLMWRLEKACRAQLAALGAQRELVMPDGEAVTKTADTYWGSSAMIAEMAWPGFRRRLDRLNPGYAS